MHQIRLYANIALAAAICLMAATCAGCWEKIEYTGPRAAVAPPSKSPTEKQSSAESAKSATAAPEAEKQADDTPNEALPSRPSPPESTAPAADGLYSSEATPETKPPTDGSPSVSPPPTESSAATVGDRYASSTPANNPPVDSSPPQSGPDISTPAGVSPPSAQDTQPTAQPAVTAPSSPSAMTTSQAAWLLGSRMSLAALAHDRGVAAKNVPAWFADAQSAAKVLGTTIGDLPEPAAADDTSPASRQVINYLLVNGQRIGRELAKQHGAEQSALFEIALKSNLLLLLYTPGSSAGDSISSAISKAAPQAKVPDELWQPLVDALNKRMSQADVRSAVRKMHGDMERYVAQPVEKSGK